MPHKKILYFSLCYWLLIIFVSVLYSNLNDDSFQYISKHPYTAFSMLWVDLKSQIVAGHFFIWCCDCMLYYADALGCSYEDLNVIVFIIIQPALMFYFFCTTLYLLFLHKKYKPPFPCSFYFVIASLLYFSCVLWLCLGLRNIGHKLPVPIHKPGVVYVWYKQFIYWANQLGYSYENLNIMLFVILMPSIIFYFMVTTIVLCRIKYNAKTIKSALSQEQL